MSHAQVAATAKVTADLEAAAEGAAKGCEDVVSRLQGIAHVLESVKTAGLEDRPERETADRIAARAILVLTACNSLLSTRTHLEHLMSDARFVTEAEECGPHESRTLRVVRVLGCGWLCGSHRACAAAATTKHLHAYACEGADENSWQSRPRHTRFSLGLFQMVYQGPPDR